ncbi:hypothetical protein [Amycolatopsis sp. NPDC051128]|uniref:hypothetical protein n=1 Tax=Amycolatopsis sp. NPDC051128 TaxID=3155412 RepID=UPI00343C85FA
MLVALQHTGDDRRLPAAAEHLVRLLRSWVPGPDHLTGLALAGISVPSRLGPRFVDALVFTPRGVIVIVAHEPGPERRPGPGERAGAGVAAVRAALAGHDGGRYVTGLVAVVPPTADSRGSEPEADPPGREPAEDSHGREPTPDPREPEAGPGVAVVLADPRGLRRIIGQHNRWRTVWSADDVLDACYALSLAHLAPSRAALLAEGFPARLPAVSQLSRLPPLPVVVPLPPAPPPPVVEDEPPLVSPARGPVSAVFPRPRPIRQVPWGLVVVLILLVAAGAVAAVVVAQVFHGS